MGLFQRCRYRSGNLQILWVYEGQVASSCGGLRSWLWIPRPMRYAVWVLRQRLSWPAASHRGCASAEGGVIADFDITTNMLENFLRRGQQHVLPPRVVICIRPALPEVERRAVREATLGRCRQVSVIEEPMAAAIAGLPIQRAYRQHDRGYRRRRAGDRCDLSGRHRGLPQRAHGR